MHPTAIVIVDHNARRAVRLEDTSKLPNERQNVGQMMPDGRMDVVNAKVIERQLGGIRLELDDFAGTRMQRQPLARLRQ